MKKAASLKQEKAPPASRAATAVLPISRYASAATLEVLQAKLPNGNYEAEWWQEHLDTTAETLETITIKVVGLQHYTGNFHAGEWVTLQREPRNPYDSNAIRVNNIAGKQIGHVNRQAAEYLAQLMDDKSLAQMYRFEANVPGPHSTHFVYIDLSFVGLLETKEDLKQFLDKAILSAGPTNLRRPIPVAVGGGGGGRRKGAAASVTTTTIIKYDKQKTEDELDKIFDELGNEAKLQADADALMKIPHLLTKLLPHQRLGVAWMQKRESGLQQGELPPFWKKEGTKFFNEISATEHDNLPNPVLGGILADGMGLGKSLQTLALCALRPAPTQKKENSGGVLIICPASVVGGWEQQILEHVESGHWHVHVHHGANRSRAELLKADVVITTFDLVAREITSKEGVGSVKWYRIVLDEAHTVRNRNTHRFKALLQLQSQYKWTLTGTPLVNTQDDIYCLFAFLGLSPLQDWTVWSRSISKPIKRGDLTGLAKLRVAIKSLCMRREKSILVLPPREIEIHQLDFADKNQLETYRLLWDASRRIFAGLSTDALLGNMTSILAIILRLRQACCDMRLVPVEHVNACREILGVLDHAEADGKELSAEEAERLLEKLKKSLNIGGAEEGDVAQAAADECAICMEPVDAETARILPKCQHCFCFSCIDRVRSMDSRCPLCRTAFSTLLMLDELQSTVEAAAKRVKLEDAPTFPTVALPGAKISSLINFLQTRPAEEKTVVFSNFTSFLNLCEAALEGAGIRFVRIDGSVSVKTRSLLVKQFQEDDTIKVFFISVKAGGTGLNLTRASNAVMLDPWWNLATEEQAWDRVYRLGQTRPVKIVRFAMKQSIELGVFNIQERKRLLSMGALAKLSAEEIRKMREADLRRLFQV